MTKWNDLSIREKVEMMRVAVRNGITTLPEIREAYNKYAEGGPVIEGGELPEVTVIPNNIYLHTYRPLIDNDYKITWHSTLISQPLWRGGRNGEYLGPGISISNDGNNPNYNLLLNNCSDATRRALEAISGDSLNPVFFTTPGDVKDFAEDKMGGVTHYQNGHYVTTIPISLKEREFLSSFKGNDPSNEGVIMKSKGGTLNKFAMGGPESDLVDRVILEEGFLDKPTNIGDGKITLGSGLTGAKWRKIYNQKGVWTQEDNRQAVSEELEARRKWAEKDIPNWDKLPEDSQNALLSYKYNYDFNKNNSPKLYKALSEGNFEEAARQIDATSKNPKFKKGLMARRQREQEWFLKGLEQVAKEAEAPVEQVAENVQMYTPPQHVVDAIRKNGKYLITGTPPLAGTRIPTSGIADGLAMQDRMSRVWKWIKDFDMLNGLIP